MMKLYKDIYSARISRTFAEIFFLIDWNHKRLKNTIDLLLFYGEHLYEFLDSEVKNHPNFVFRQFHVFVYGPLPKTKTWNWWKVSGKFIHCTNDGEKLQWQLDHLILFLLYNTDYFLKLLYLFEIVFKQKIGNRNFICAIENTLPKLKTGPVYLSKLWSPLFETLK